MTTLAANDPNKPKSQINTFRLKGLIIAVYFGVVLFLTLCMIYGDIPVPYPASWLNLINFVYYFLPYVIAVWAGLMLRPFWPSFRNIFVGILIIHLFYSFGIYMGHAYYLEQWERQIQRQRLEEINILKASHQHVKDPLGNSILKVLVTVQLDAAGLSPGNYEMTAELSQRGRAIDDARSASYHFVIAEKGSKIFQTTLLTELNLDSNFSKNPLDIDLKVMKKMLVEQKVKRFLFFARWAAFFRTTNWEGEAAELTDRWIEMHLFRRVDSLRWRAVR